MRLYKYKVKDNAVVSMGIFKVDRSGTNLMKLKSMPEPDGVKKICCYN
ncbi:MAG: hypothetical protein HYW01_06715 [Deltaproteobacteria bacterium]|nr:hypothetical protein [Deltaproteobacteria bacterium]